jgi:LysM repeat protein
LEVRYQDHPLDPFAFIDWTNKKLKTKILVFEKKIFSPWDLGIEPADISKPDFKTVSNPNITQTTNETVDVNASYHVIKKGDTLYSIAKANGTTLEQICTWNGITDPNKIFLGQKIRVK